MNKPYYNVCPNCGAHLDPSERCDCMDNTKGRLSDGKILRVTSDGDDNATSASASLNMRVCTAEEWTIPN